MQFLIDLSSTLTFLIPRKKGCCNCDSLWDSNWLLSSIISQYLHQCMSLWGTSIRLVSFEKTKHLDAFKCASLISLFLMLNTNSNGSIPEHSTLHIKCFICISQQYLCIFQSLFFSISYYSHSISPKTCCFIPCRPNWPFTAIILIAFSCMNHILNSTRQ